ncbi:transmembrane protein 272-like [Pholidichthys leucotaenia]
MAGVNTNRCQTIIIMIVLVVFIIMVTAEVAVGGIYGNDCPRQPFIPIYLYAVAPILMVLSMFKRWWNLTCCAITTAFFFCWFLAGNVVIYSIYPPNYNKNTTDTNPYCNKTLYLFAFWCTNLTYILLAVLLPTLCCCKQEDADEDNEAQTLVQE